MTNPAEIFQTHRENYRQQIAHTVLSSVKDILGLKQKGERFFLPFFGQEWGICRDGTIQDESGKNPDYAMSVILSNYLILCPDQIYEDMQWSAFKDFKRTAQFLNMNYFASATENVIASALEGKGDKAEDICRKSGGKRADESFAYDLIMRFDALPRISLLLLFSEGDEDFPAYGTVLFPKHAEYYLDPESLAMTSACLAGKIKETAKLMHL